MTRIPNRDEQLARCRYQYDQAKLYAEKWIAEVNSGAYSLRQISQGREVTEEEKARGEIVGWRPLEDVEKAQRALGSATTHIQRLEGLGEIICTLIADDPERLAEAMRWANR